MAIDRGVYVSDTVKVNWPDNIVSPSHWYEAERAKVDFDYMSMDDKIRTVGVMLATARDLGREEEANHLLTAHIELERAMKYGIAIHRGQSPGKEEELEEMKRRWLDRAEDSIDRALKS